MISSLRIMIVEDDAIIALCLSELLTQIGGSVCAVSCTYDEAVADAARHYPDLILVDAGLTTGSGIEAIQEITRTGFVRHIYVTGDAARVREQVPNAIIVQKPFSLACLKTAIASAYQA
ncbi:MAG: response regulator [Sphingomonadaceae bacterium]